jgi:hypothetical protein
MAIRLATLATVPVNRVCIEVRPLSKGELLIACANTGETMSSVKRLRKGRIQ